MISKFESEISQSTGKPGEAEIVRRSLEGYIQTTSLESPQFQAFADYTDLQEALKREYRAGVKPEYSADHVKETIRQRVNGVIGYKKALEQVKTMVEDYRKTLPKRDSQYFTQTALSNALAEMKDKAIDEKTEKYIAKQHHKTRW